MSNKTYGMKITVHTSNELAEGDINKLANMLAEHGCDWAMSYDGGPVNDDMDYETTIYVSDADKFVPLQLPTDAFVYIERGAFEFGCNCGCQNAKPVPNVLTFESALAEANHQHLHITAFNIFNCNGYGDDIEFCGADAWDAMTPEQRSVWLVSKCDAKLINGNWTHVLFDSACDSYGTESIWEPITMNTAKLIELSYLAPAWEHARDYDSAESYAEDLLKYANRVQS